jgi:asparagine synthase (glutamine-hydrolysing)
MCGIAGVIFDEDQGSEIVRPILSAMCEAQAQRGPDARYFWTDGRVGLGMVRLAIVGSEGRGQQPIESAARGRLIFNGELYRPREVMAWLGGDFAQDECDGAALLRLLEERGTDALNRVSAMFALALHRSQDDSVLLVRDAWGQKPLYRTRMKNGWAFASTIAALHAAAGPFQVRSEAMYECLIFKSVGGCGSAFVDVEQVPPGGWMRINRGGSTTAGRWFSPPSLESIDADPGRTCELISDAIRVRLPESFRSSIFLSGGLDSSIVASVTARSSNALRPHVFTVGYDVGGGEDEHRLAVQLAGELGLESFSLMVRVEDVPALLTDTAMALEDPNHDPVVVPTLLLARAAAEETKVVLTGDGSDEFWGGYSRFDNPPSQIEAYLDRTMVFRPEELGIDGIPESYLRGIDLPPSGSMPLLDRIMRLEAANRLRNYHLARIDKLCMAASLEARSPFLDLAVTRYAESMPAEAKRPGGRPKGVLIDAFRSLLPQWLIERRKQAFTVPIQKWLTGGLCELVHDTLSRPTAFVRAFSDPAPLLAGLAEPASNLHLAMQVWSLLHLEIWHQKFARRMEQQP